MTSSTPGIAWPLPISILYSFGAPITPSASADASKHRDEIALMRLALHRRPRRALIAQTVDLFANDVVGDRDLRSRDVEAVDALELHVRPHLTMQLEGERLAVVELHVVGVRLCHELELLALDHRVIRLFQQVVERFLADLVGEFLPNHRGRRFALSETGQAGGGRVPARHAFRRGAHFVGGTDTRIRRSTPSFLVFSILTFIRRGNLAANGATAPRRCATPIPRSHSPRHAAHHHANA